MRTESPLPSESSASSADRPDLQTMVRTLVANGFDVRKVTQKPHYALVSCARYDEFGGTIAYEFALCEQSLRSSEAAAVRRHAEHDKAIPVIVGSAGTSTEVSELQWNQFLGRCGGPVKSWLPLQADFGANLIELGHNRAVPGLLGRPDDLFEQYVHAGLQFILAEQVVRYGQNRRGEILPDGGAFGHRNPLFLYDAKAYESGYPLSRDGIRQFGDYVRRFHRKYETSVGRLAAFLVVSGHFADDSPALIRYSQDLQADCGIPLAYLTAAEMAQMTMALCKRPTFRNILDWNHILSRVIISFKDIRRHLTNAEKDRLVH
jgi:hypothetical protein